MEGPWLVDVTFSQLHIAHIRKYNPFYLMFQSMILSPVRNPLIIMITRLFMREIYRPLAYVIYNEKPFADFCKTGAWTKNDTRISTLNFRAVESRIYMGTVCSLIFRLRLFCLDFRLLIVSYQLCQLWHFTISCSCLDHFFPHHSQNIFTHWENT